LFDGRSEADADIAANQPTTGARRSATSPSSTETIVVFDFDEWKSEIATRKNPDGTISFVTIAPGLAGFEFLVGSGAKRPLIARDAQHEYTFTEQ
jgi:hypothetical protein